MPGKLRRLSGSELVAIFRLFGFHVIKQEGSHAKIRRVARDGSNQTLVIPLHEELHKGTQRAIFRQACAYISQEELHPHFYAN